MAGPEIEALIHQIAKLPGVGPRSARRIALALIKRRTVLLDPLVQALTTAAATIKICTRCGNFDSQDPCSICADPRRDPAIVCVVEDVADLWAMERAALYRGRYHVSGGVLSPLAGIGPEDLKIDRLVERVRRDQVKEVILALSATVDGQTTAHYIADRLRPTDVVVSGLAHGLPVGGELDYLDDGTIAAALTARRPVPN
jgi:recombination protein RecR